MNLEFYNCPEPEKFDPSILPAEDPLFVSYEPDFLALEKLTEQYGNYENYLVIANGGSINSFYGFYNALKYQAQKQAYFLNTLDPDYIFELKQKLKPENTLVLCISKSGENTMQLEMAMAFEAYKTLVVTGLNSPLYHMAEKLGLTIVIHPEIGGRYTAFTEVAFLPALLCGLDIKAIFRGGREFLKNYKTGNPAFQAASVFWQLEQKGFAEVFMPIYSHSLFPISIPIVQLCHESFGKNGRGQSILAFEAPESQHHTNQRFFGGKKNICGMFLSTETVLHPTANSFPLKAHKVDIKGHFLGEISGVPLEKSLEFELKGTLKDAQDSQIPCAHLSISSYEPEQIGQLMAFWQLYALYSSQLRGVNPFDQPQVEASKNISFQSRLVYKHST